MHAVQMARYLFLIFTGGTAVKGYPDVEALVLSEILTKFFIILAYS